MNKRIIIVIVVILCLALFALFAFPQVEPVNLTLDTTKLDADGNEIGSIQIKLEGSKYDYFFLPDQLIVSIAPFDGHINVEVSNYVSKGRETKGQIQKSVLGDFFYVSCGGWYTPNDDLFFADLAFSPDLDCWLFRDKSNELYYVASIIGRKNTEELVDYFSQLIR